MRGIAVILQPNLLRKSGQMFLSCCHFCFKKNLRMADMTPSRHQPSTYYRPIEITISGVTLSKVGQHFFLEIVADMKT